MYTLENIWQFAMPLLPIAPSCHLRKCFGTMDCLQSSNKVTIFGIVNYLICYDFIVDGGMVLKIELLRTLDSSIAVLIRQPDVSQMPEVFSSFFSNALFSAMVQSTPIKSIRQVGS